MFFVRLPHVLVFTFLALLPSIFAPSENPLCQGSGPYCSGERSALRNLEWRYRGSDTLLDLTWIHHLQFKGIDNFIPFTYNLPTFDEVADPTLCGTDPTLNACPIFGFVENECTFVFDGQYSNGIISSRLVEDVDHIFTSDGTCPIRELDISLTPEVMRASPSCEVISTNHGNANIETFKCELTVCQGIPSCTRPECGVQGWCDKLYLEMMVIVRVANKTSHPIPQEIQSYYSEGYCYVRHEIVVPDGYDLQTAFQSASSSEDPLDMGVRAYVCAETPDEAGYKTCVITLRSEEQCDLGSGNRWNGISTWMGLLWDAILEFHVPYEISGITPKVDYIELPAYFDLATDISELKIQDPLLTPFQLYWTATSFPNRPITIFKFEDGPIPNPETVLIRPDGTWKQLREGKLSDGNDIQWHGVQDVSANPFTKMQLEHAEYDLGDLFLLRSFTLSDDIGLPYGSKLVFTDNVKIVEIDTSRRGSLQFVSLGATSAWGMDSDFKPPPPPFSKELIVMVAGLAVTFLVVVAIGCGVGICVGLLVVRKGKCTRRQANKVVPAAMLSTLA